jgi:hypothetical protein
VNRCLAEGRKSFLARYAGIEAGEECARWAPVLSAMVDGEATAEQLMALRPHLRNCAGCRAAVRELRGSNAPLAALFPIGALGAMGDDDGGPLDGAGDLLSRLWHSLWGDLSDRAATAAFRAQSVAQAIVPGKSMAILGSVAALAGGGFAIDEAARSPTPPRAALQVPTVSAAADRITRASVPAATTTAASTAKGKPKAKRRPRVRRHTRRARRAAATTRRISPRPAVTRPPATTTTTAATTPAATPPPPPRAVVAASAPKPPPAPAPASGSGASGEFGPESH